MTSVSCIATVSYTHLDVYKRQVLDYLAALVCSVNETRQISDISAAFEADIRKPMGKTVIRWNM